MLASVLAGKPMAVSPVGDGQPAWTDGQTVFIDPSAPVGTTLAAVAVQASLVAAGSLADGIIRSVAGHPRLTRRYLAVEGHRALAANDHLLPAVLRSLADPDVAGRSDGAQTSLAIAVAKEGPAEAPAEFGVIRAGKIRAAAERASADQQSAGHLPRSRDPRRELAELDDGEADGTADMSSLVSPVGGGGFVGKWLAKMLSSARGSGTGGGPPGAEAPTHRARSAERSVRSVHSSTTVAPLDEIKDVAQSGFSYPEWDVGHKRYRNDWCTVQEVRPRARSSAPHTIEAGISAHRPLARLGVGLDRRHRQYQGDDIDIDAAIEARVGVHAGAVPDEAVYLDSVRRRRDLSVLLLLDVSGSAGEPGSRGRTVHDQQRAAAATLLVALHDLGDRVALYGYNSHGRGAVRVVPVKLFDDQLDARVINRLNSLEPGGYSRLGAAIRHGAAVVESRGGTSRQLLVVISDGLAYDHGYERNYGAADARRALTEARRRGTGCVCLTVGASTDAVSLRSVFGSAAHATVGEADQLVGVIGPLFRSALRSAEVRRRIS
ncbi:nitric oxide reductase activation protein NorD [Mycobacterium pinniadriaticum]